MTAESIMSRAEWRPIRGGTLDSSAQTSSAEVRLAGRTQSTSLPRPEWFEDVFNDVVEIMGSGGNWDGFGSRAVTQKAAFHLLRFLSNDGSGIRIRPSISGTSYGGVVAEIRGEDAELQVEVSPLGQLSFYILDWSLGVEWEGPAEHVPYSIGPSLSRVLNRR